MIIEIGESNSCSRLVIRNSDMINVMRKYQFPNITLHAHLFQSKSPLIGFPPNPYAHHNSPRSARQLVLLDKTDYTKQSIQRPSNYLENDQLNQLGFSSGKLVFRNPSTNFRNPTSPKFILRYLQLSKIIGDKSNGRIVAIR